MTAKTTIIKNVTVYSVYLVLMWAFYRFIFQLPDNVRRTCVKPFFGLSPIFWLTNKEGLKLSSLGITFKISFLYYLSIGLGTVFVAEGL